jgi:hypothetical protein
MIAGGFNFASLGGTCGGQGQAFPAQQGTFAGPNARVRLAFNCGDLRVTTAAGAGWTLNGSGEEGRPPTIAAAGDSLAIESRNRTGFFLFGGSDRDDWSLVLPTEPTLDLETAVNASSAQLDLVEAKVSSARFTVNAGSIRVDLTGATVGRLDVRVNAASAGIILPNSSMTGNLEANAGSIEICAPPGAGLRISTNDNITAANNFGDRGLTRIGAAWETPGYTSAAVQIDLRATANAASLTLNPEDGC